MTAANTGALQTPSKSLQMTPNGMMTTTDEKLSAQLISQHKQQHQNDQLVDFTQQNPGL